MPLPFIRRSTYDSLLRSDGEKFQAQADRIRMLESQLATARDSAEQSASEARDALRLVADWLAEHQFGRPIFGGAPALPETAPTSEALDQFNTSRGRAKARDLARQGYEQFMTAYGEAIGHRGLPAPEQK